MSATLLTLALLLGGMVAASRPVSNHAGTDTHRHRNATAGRNLYALVLVMILLTGAVLWPVIKGIPGRDVGQRLWQTGLAFVDPCRGSCDLENRIALLTDRRAITDVQGRLVGFLQPGPTPIRELPERSVHALIASENHRIYRTQGSLDPRSCVRALAHNVITTAGRGAEPIQGCSTIPDFLARCLVGDRLPPEGTLRARAAETRVANALLTKNRYQQNRDVLIHDWLAFCANFGPGAIGLHAALEKYFGKTAPEASLAEICTLVGSLPSPALTNPLTNPEKANKRKLRCLDRLEEHFPEYAQEIQQARRETVSVRRTIYSRPITADYIRAMRKVGIVTSADTIRAALDLDLQLAGAALLDTIVATVESGLHGAPLLPRAEVGASLLVMDATSGHVRALIDGPSAPTSWPRVMTGLESTGSAWKAFLLAIGYEFGVVRRDAQLGEICAGLIPNKWTDSILQRTDLTLTVVDGFAVSDNGLPACLHPKVKRYLRSLEKIGFTGTESTSPIDALGTYSAPLASLVPAFSSLETGRKPTLIFEAGIATSLGRAAWRESTVELMRNALSAVAQPNGTGRAAGRAFPGRFHLKTGTTGSRSSGGIRSVLILLYDTHTNLVYGLAASAQTPKRFMSNGSASSVLLPPLLQLIKDYDDIIARRAN